MAGGMNVAKFTVEYNSNNSGGDWWLADSDWQRLEEAGWFVHWGGLDFCNSTYRMSTQRHTAPDIHEPDQCPGHRRSESYDEAVASGDRWLGAIATSATIEIEAYSDSLAEGVAKEWWQDTLGMDADEVGCNCCGRPHSFWARAKAVVPA